MNKMPDKLRLSTQGHRVLYWGRRKTFEMVEEGSDFVLKGSLIITMFVSMAMVLELHTSRNPIVNPIGWYVVCFIILLFIGKRFIKEYMDWKNELYAVSSDDQGGGRIYWYRGWLEEIYIPEAITKTSPNISPRRPWYYKFWGWLTGERMEQVTIKSANNIDIKARKVDPKFAKSIEDIQKGLHNDGNQPGSLLDLRSGREIERMVDAGLIEWRLAQQAAETIVKRQVWG
jgi:hypothetical protein